MSNTKRSKGKVRSKRQFNDRRMNDRERDEKFGGAPNAPTTHKYNDVSWYTKNSQMLIDAASYSYSTPLGSPVPYSQLCSGVKNYPLSDRAISGMMEIEFVPTIGVSTDSTSPANVAAQNIYSYVRYMNSGAKNYDQADLMLYLLAMDSLYMYWNWMKRIYGYLSIYSQYNKYMPRVYANVDRVDFNDLVGRLADFREFINQSAARLSAFCVPAVMPYFIRHSWMVSNIYKDSDSLKSQQFMFTPRYFYKYDETGSKYGGQLLPAATRSINSPLTFAQIQAKFEELFTAVAYSEDIGVMSGDILKAYGNEKLFKLTPVDPNYTVEPVYNEEVLSQIHNLTVTQLNGSAADTLNVTQNPDTGYLIYNPTVIPWAYVPLKTMINMPWDGVTPAQTMVATRLTTVFNNDKIVGCGSEIVSSMRIHTLLKDGRLTYTTIDSPLINISAIEVAEPQQMVTLMNQISQFDWHPLFHVVLSHGSADKAYHCGILGDVNNYTIIDADDVYRMHSTALMSEFNIPQLGSF